MFDTLPRDARDTLTWSWDQFKAYYDDLATRSVDNANVDLFLSQWTRLTDLLDETYCRLYVATTRNTADEEAERGFHRFLDEIFPEWEKAEQKLKTIILEQETPPGFELPMRRIKTESELFREENLPLMTEDQKLTNEYDSVIGRQTVQWDGKEVTIAQLRPVYQEQDRDLRERAWRLSADRQMEDRSSLDELWRKLMNLRIRMAVNAGFSDYRSYRWKELARFDYAPEDCKLFHEAILEVFTPLGAKVCEARRKRLALGSLRPWDLEVDPLGRPPLAPFQEVARLKEGVLSVFERLHEGLASHFRTMMDEDLLDLENRKNKAPGGYCIGFSSAKRPFIFMNAVGVQDDVQTLLHESGHAFHHFATGRLPYHQQRQVGMEFAEVASMSMELLASPFLALDQGGFYSQADAERALDDHLEKIILFWPFMAVVDAFQHWVYENPSHGAEPSACDDKWAELFTRFVPWIDWTGLEDILASGWQRKLHIFTVPFYYVEYGFAQLGAVQVWGASLQDRKQALDAYLRGLALGGTVSIPELFKAVGAEFAFDADTLRRAARLIERRLDH